MEEEEAWPAGTRLPDRDVLHSHGSSMYYYALPLCGVTRYRSGIYYIHIVVVFFFFRCLCAVWQGTQVTWYSLHLHSSSIFFSAAFVRCDKVPKWYSLHSPCSNFFLFFLSLSLCGVTRCPSGIHYIHMVVVCIHTGRTSFFTETFTETRLHSQKLEHHYGQCTLAEVVFITFTR